MAKTNQTPEIRFKGFTDAWEQRKLGALVQFSKGTGYSKADLKESGTPIILYGRLYTKYETVISDVDTYADAKAGSVYSRGGEVIVPASGETAEDISIASVVEKSGVLLGGDLNIITPPRDLDSAFLAISISNGKPHDDMAKMAQGKSVVHLHNTDLEKIDLAYPSHEEQVQISSCFKRLDNLITLHQRKLLKTQNFKRAMLEKMFPKNGESVPKIRFAGFTDAWEQRKFSDFAQRESSVGTSSYDHPSVEYEDVVAEEGRLNKDIRKKEVRKTGIEFDGTQVLYGKLRPYLHNWLNPDFTGVAVGDWWVLRPVEIDKNFLFRLIQTKQFDEVANQSSGSKMPRADWNLVSNTEFSIPVSLDEQSQIAKAFENLDNLITLHQRKLEKLQNIKKSLLAKMFV